MKATADITKKENAFSFLLYKLRLNVFLFDICKSTKKVWFLQIFHKEFQSFSQIKLVYFLRFQHSIILAKTQNSLYLKHFPSISPI